MIQQTELVEKAGARGASTLMARLRRHDAYTEAHCRRAAVLSMAVGRALGLTGKGLRRLQLAGLLHDIGKLGVPATLLRKAGSLGDDELEAVRVHPVLGAQILARSRGLQDLASIVMSHHERFDGLGYPQGLAREDIPLEARVIFVADAFDAMTSRRSYGDVLAASRALAELRLCSGRQFDPLVVEALHECISAQVSAL